MGKIKITWNSERILSITAMVMSFITLVIFIRQTNLMSRQNYLTILPYLQLSEYNVMESFTFGTSLKNHGVGPAILESVIMEYQGKRYDLKDFDNELHTFFSSLSPQLDSVDFSSFGTVDKGIAIPANTTYELFLIEGDSLAYQQFTSTLETLLKNGLRYEIIYKSIQDERWMIYNDSEGPQKLD